jgi:hypothetical protein
MKKLKKIQLTACDLSKENILDKLEQKALTGGVIFYLGCGCADCRKYC